MELSERVSCGASRMTYCAQRNYVFIFIFYLYLHGLQSTGDASEFRVMQKESNAFRVQSEQLTINHILMDQSSVQMKQFRRGVECLPAFTHWFRRRKTLISYFHRCFSLLSIERPQIEKLN